jgi:hypothetical protein
MYRGTKEEAVGVSRRPIDHLKVYHFRTIPQSSKDIQIIIAHGEIYGGVINIL